MAQELTASEAFQTQCFNIPDPVLTEKNLPDQTGKIVIVTGGYAGVGEELSRILYEHNATVYIAGRSSDKAARSIANTKSLIPKSNGALKFLSLDLADLSSIKKSAEEFKSTESRLDVLINNAGVMVPPTGDKDANGHELQMGTNVLGPFLFTHHLLPILKKTASSSPANSVRVTWAGSLVTILYAPLRGVQFDAQDNPHLHPDQFVNYGQSKVGNLFLAAEFAKRHRVDGIVSVCFNPGNLKTELQRHMDKGELAQSEGMMHPAIFGAYTELYSGFSEEITLEKSGNYVIPWGRDGNWTLRADVTEGYENEGPSKLWKWCEKETSAYT